MKVGLLAVYIFDDRTRALFDIHLERIRRHTHADFHIYGAGHKLADAQFDHVAGNDDITLLTPEVPSHYGVREEHSHCLRLLADHAFADGCDHVICMHLDSFPVCDSWLERFRGPIVRGEADVVSIVPNGYSAGLCWSRALDQELSPPMLVPACERETERFARFTAEFPDFDHVETGLGILYTTWREGRTWRRIGTDAARKIYGGVLFHVVGATFRTWVDCAPIKRTLLARSTWPLMEQAIKILPRSARRAVRMTYIDTDKVTRDGSFHSKAAENAALMNDPDGYVGKFLVEYADAEKIYS